MLVTERNFVHGVRVTCLGKGEQALSSLRIARRDKGARFGNFGFLIQRIPPFEEAYSSYSRYFMAYTAFASHLAPLSDRPRVEVESMGISSVAISSMLPSSVRTASM